jgi:hypothetical protein
MPVTLAQSKLNTQDDLDRNVIDEFRKESAILDALPFHDAVSPMGGGSTLTYGYHRLVTQPTADFRAINSEYTPSEVTKARYTTELKPLGGSFQVDRVLAGLARGAEVTLQMQQKIKATRTRFADELINGDTAVDADGFDGLDLALTGSTTEMNADLMTDWTAITSADDTPFVAIDTLDEFLQLLDGPPTMIIANRKALARIRGIARRAALYIRNPVADLLDATTRQPIQREQYGNILLVDPGEKAGSSDLIIPIEDRTVDGTPQTGLTDIYAVRFGMDAFHGVSVSGQQLVRTWLPNFEEAGAVKSGEVEMGPVAVALKATKAAAVLRNVKVQ